MYVCPGISGLLLSVWVAKIAISKPEAIAAIKVRFEDFNCDVDLIKLFNLPINKQMGF